MAMTGLLWRCWLRINIKWIFIAQNYFPSQSEGGNLEILYRDRAWRHTCICHLILLPSEDGGLKIKPYIDGFKSHQSDFLCFTLKLKYLSLKLPLYSKLGFTFIGTLLCEIILLQRLPFKRVLTCQATKLKKGNPDTLVMYWLPIAWQLREIYFEPFQNHQPIPYKLTLVLKT